MFTKGNRVIVTPSLPADRRYNRLVDGDEGVVVYAVGGDPSSVGRRGLIGLVLWDKDFRSNVNWGMVDVIK